MINYTDLVLNEGEELMLVSLRGKQVGIVIKSVETTWPSAVDQIMTRYLKPCIQKLLAEIAT